MSQKEIVNKTGFYFLDVWISVLACLLKEKKKGEDMKWNEGNVS